MQLIKNVLNKYSNYFLYNKRSELSRKLQRIILYYFMHMVKMILLIYCLLLMIETKFHSCLS